MRGRIADGQARTNVTFSLTDEVNAKLSMLVHDPVAGRAKYGLKSKIGEELINRFFDAVVKGEDSLNIRDLRVEVEP